MTHNPNPRPTGPDPALAPASAPRWPEDYDSCPRCRRSFSFSGPKTSGDVCPDCKYRPPAADAPDTAAGTYHGRIMNMQIDPSNVLDGWTAGELRAYKYGHRDARHNAAVLGNDADIALHTALSRAEAAEAELARLRVRIDALTHPANDMTGRAYEAGRSDSEKSLVDMDEEIRALQDAMPDPVLIEQFVEWTQEWAPSYGWTDEVGDMASRLRNAAAAIRAALASQEATDASN